MKIIDKSIRLSHELFPEVYEQKSYNVNYHFAFGYCRSKLIRIGFNDYAPSNKARKLGEIFNIDHTKKWPYLHAETDLISKLLGWYHIDSSLKVVVIRLNKFHKLQMSKPCTHCTTILKALNVSEVYWSDRQGDIQYGL
jgi:hypothetical protein